MVLAKMLSSRSRCSVFVAVSAVSSQEASFTSTANMLVSFTLVRRWVVDVVVIGWMFRIVLMSVGASRVVGLIRTFHLFHSASAALVVVSVMGVSLLHCFVVGSSALCCVGCLRRDVDCSWSCFCGVGWIFFVSYTLVHQSWL